MPGISAMRARLRVCDRSDFSGADFLVCVSVTGGAIDAEGRNVDRPERALAGWLSAGGSVRVPISLGENVRLVPGITGEIPITRPTFGFGPKEAISLHRPAPWVLGVSLGTEVVF